ncbi:MAG TPA: STAS domain-containing protein [Acidimicrobiia bacterium]|nr:STAS domain-containing protein [Acidimicrobiia bacterium]
MQTHDHALGSADFDIRVGRQAGDVVVTVLGEIDMASAPLLWERLTEAIPDASRALVIDLSGTTFIDSTGMAVLIRAQRHLRRRGAELIVRSPRPSARKVLAITGLDTIITIQDGPVTATTAP